MVSLDLLGGLKDLQGRAAQADYRGWLDLGAIVQRHVDEHVNYVSAMQPDLLRWDQEEL